MDTGREGQSNSRIGRGDGDGDGEGSGGRWEEKRASGVRLEKGSRKGASHGRDVQTQRSARNPSHASCSEQRTLLTGIATKNSVHPHAPRPILVFSAGTPPISGRRARRDGTRRLRRLRANVLAPTSVTSAAAILRHTLDPPLCAAESRPAHRSHRPLAGGSFCVRA